MPSASTICPDCGSPIPADAPGCIPCLLSMAQSASADVIAPLAPEGERERVGRDPGASPSAMLPAPGSALPASTFPLRVIGDYDLLREIGRGGMGVVYEARQRSLNRKVALKLILAGEFASETTVARFREEAELIASLHHPNITPIHEIGEHQGWHYYSMKLIEGHTLAALIPNNPGRRRREESQTSPAKDGPNKNQRLVTSSPPSGKNAAIPE